jgi:hypothetical protein
MKTDPFITHYLSFYGLRLLKLSNFAPKEPDLRLIYAALSQKELVRINAYIQKELTKFHEGVIDPLSGQVPVSRRRFSKNDIIKKQFIEDVPDDLHNSLHDDDCWIRVLEVIRSGDHSLFKRVCAMVEERLVYQSKLKVNSVLQKQLDQIVLAFKLSSGEVDILILLFLIEIEHHVDNYFCSHLNLNKVGHSIRIFSRFFKMKPQDIRKFLSKDSLLVRGGIIEKKSDSIALATHMVRFLSGLGTNDVKESFLSSKKSDMELTPAQFALPEASVELILKLLSTDIGTNILLYGKPGTGKTEFSLALGYLTKRKVFFVNAADDSGDENLDFRKSAIIASQNLLEPEEAIIVVDECDTIINISNGFWGCDDGKKDTKAWINKQNIKLSGSPIESTELMNLPNVDSHTLKSSKL